METGADEAVRHNRIPSLDGIRAVAIAIVVFGHGIPTMPLEIRGIYTSVFPEKGFGVQVFFVLSGYLITSLLMNEKRKRGTISLKRFYIGRAFRILPAYYVFLLVVSALLAADVIKLQWHLVLASAFFVRDYVPSSDSWWLGHTWSLSIEEQFYLLWPFLFRSLARPSLIKLLFALALASPFIRLATWVFMPSLRRGIPIMFHTRMDGLVMGCLLAMLWSNPTVRARTLRYIEAGLGWIAPSWLILSIWASRHYGEVWNYSLGYLFDSLAIALILIWVVEKPSCIGGRILNMRWVKALGVISYSTYLWQQLFMTTKNTTVAGMWPLNVICSLLAATASYWLIEKAFLRMRSRYFGRAAPTD